MGLNVRRFAGIVSTLVVFFFLVDIISPVEIERKYLVGALLIALIGIASYLLSLEGK